MPQQQIHKLMKSAYPMYFKNKIPDKIPAERLHDLLTYDAMTGVLTWKHRPDDTHGNKIFNSRDANNRAGHVQASGYRVITIDGRGYGAAQIAWAMMHRRWPVDKVFHRGPVDDDSFANLYCLSEEKFILRADFNGHAIELGRFATREEAALAYVSMNFEIVDVE